jgi:hypothetical protein
LIIGAKQKECRWGVLVSGQQKLEEVLRFYCGKGDKGEKDFVSGMLSKINRDLGNSNRSSFNFRCNGGYGNLYGSTIEINPTNWIGEEYFVETWALEWSPYGCGADTATMISDGCGVPYGIYSIDMEIEHSKEDDLFHFDFDRIVAGMREALGEDIPEIMEISGEQLLHKFMDAKRYDFTMVFFDGPEFTASVNLHWVAGPYADSGDVFLWSHQGAVLTGPMYGTLPEPLQDRFRLKASEVKAYYPSVSISIMNSHMYFYGRLPMFDEERKKKVRELADRVAKTFTGKSAEISIGAKH